MSFMNIPETPPSLGGPLDDTLDDVDEMVRHLGVTAPLVVPGANVTTQQIDPTIAQKLEGVLSDFHRSGWLLALLYTIHVIGLAVGFFVVLNGSWADEPSGYDTSSGTPPYECCNCDYYHWRRAWYYILFAILFAQQLYGLWSIGERIHSTIRMNIYNVMRVAMLYPFYVPLLFGLIVLLFPLCNFPYIWFNPCNDPLWKCAQVANLTELNTTCIDCPYIPYPVDALNYNPRYVGMVIVVAASFVLAVITEVLHTKHNYKKLAVVAAIPGDSNQRSYEYNSLVVVILVIAILYLLSYPIVIWAFSAGYLPARYEYDTSTLPPVLYDERYGTMWLFQLLWSLPLGSVLIACYVLYPIYTTLGKDVARALLLLVTIYQALLLLVALVAYLLHLATIINIPEFASSYFVALTVSLLIQWFLGLILLAAMVALVKLAELSRERAGEIARTDEIAKRGAPVVVKDELQL